MQFLAANDLEDNSDPAVTSSVDDVALSELRQSVAELRSQMSSMEDGLISSTSRTMQAVGDVERNTDNVSVYLLYDAFYI